MGQAAATGCEGETSGRLQMLLSKAAEQQKSDTLVLVSYTLNIWRLLVFFVLCPMFYIFDIFEVFGFGSTVFLHMRWDVLIIFPAVFLKEAKTMKS